MTKRFELRLCSNGTYYVYENGTLTDIDFDKFNKESAYALIDEVNTLYKEKEKLKIFLKAVNEELSLANRDNDTLAEENEQLKQALREQLEENGNAYCIEILDKIFNLKYDEWQRKMNETHTYDYIDWENVLNDKGDV